MLQIKYFFTVFLFTLTATNAYNSNKTFNAITVTDPGIVNNVQLGDIIKCKILNIASNVTIKLVKNDFQDSFDTSVGYSKNITIPNDCVKFSIYQFANSSNIWSKFRILNALSNATYYFILGEDGLQLYRINAVTESMEWDHFYEIDNFLPKETETSFWFDYQNDDLVFGAENYGIITILPINKETRPHIMQIEGEYVANAYWDLKDCANSSREYTFDKLTTYCWNSTDDDDGNNENNGTETYFTTMIDIQYRINKVMEKDLKDFKKWDSSMMIKELIEEFLRDVKDNYQRSLNLHKIITKSYQLNKYETNLKRKYLKEYIFADTRQNYFQLYKEAQLILSRFR